MKGYFFIILGAFFFSGMNLCVRVGQQFSPHCLVFYRLLVQTLFLLPFVFSFSLTPEKLKFHFLRATFGVTSLFFLYLSLHFLPLGLATLVGMTSVIWSGLFGWKILGEKVGLRKMGGALLVIFGIAFVLLAYPLTWNLYGILAALFCGLTTGGAFATLRTLRQKATTVETVFFFGVIGLLWMAPFFAYRYDLPTTSKDILLALLIGCLGTLGQLSMTYGFGKVGAFLGNVTYLVQTLLSLILGHLFLAEPLPKSFFLGLGFVSVGIALFSDFKVRFQELPFLLKQRSHHQE